MPSRPLWPKNRFPQLVLASASPRRKEILKAAGFRFGVFAVSVPEVRKSNERARDFVRRLAAKKAEAARDRLGNDWKHPILGADTVVVLGRRTLGKPASAADARRMLRLLSGRRHQVLTGLCLLFRSGGRWKRSVRVATTTVKFCRLNRGEIEAYVASGEPLDKAGAYAIQGIASRYVEWIEGCYFNVVGLPVSLLYRMFIRSLASKPTRSP